jgi:hypothetical protein
METAIHTRRAEIAATRARDAKPKIVILARPAFDHRGRRLQATFDALLGDRLLARGSRQPFLDGARELAELGYPPETAIVMRRPGHPMDCLRSTIAAASVLTVKERMHGGLLFERWEADSRSLGGAPIKKTGKPDHPGRVAPTQGGAA